MFFGNVLLDKKGPYSILWKAAHGLVKTIPKNDIKNFNAVKHCEDLESSIPGGLEHLDAKTKFSLYLISNLMYGMVIIVDKQCTILLADAEEVRASLSIFFNRKRKRVPRGRLSLEGSPKRKKADEKKADELEGALITFDIMMNEELDQAFLGNRLEVARHEDITLKEFDRIANIDEQFSDALHDFGEKSTFRDLFGVEIENATETREVVTADVLAPANVPAPGERVQEEVVSHENTEIKDLSIADQKKKGSVEEPLRISAEKELVETVAMESVEKTAEKTKTPKGRGRKRQAATKENARAQLCDIETKLSTDYMKKRMENFGQNLRDRSSLFTFPKVDISEDRRFAASFVNRLFGEDWLPKARQLEPLNFEGAPKHSFQLPADGVVRPASQEASTSNVVNELIEKERARQSSSMFSRKSVSRSATWLQEDRKVSSPTLSLSDYFVKVSVPLPSIWPKEYVEEWSGLAKSSVTLHDIMLTDDMLQGYHAERQGSPVPQPPHEIAIEPIPVDENAFPPPALTVEAVRPSSPVEGPATYTCLHSAEQMLERVEAHITMRKKDRLVFSAFLGPCSRAVAARSFCNLLTLLKDGKVQVKQDEPFGEISVWLTQSSA